jgi:formylglycine-generating enzyme required for sulfatase activity
VRFVSVGAVGAMALSLGGCWTVLGLGDKEFDLGSGGATTTSSTSTTTGAGGGREGMVRVEHGAQSFYIDATEVTNEAYLAWLMKSPSPTSSDPHCGWNTSVHPGTLDGCPQPSDPQCDAMVSGFESYALLHPKEPVACVDFCDATAYCEGQGKHICGGPKGAFIEIQTEPGPFVSDASQWYFACSGGQGNKYPYGPTLQMGLCNDGFANRGMVVDVGETTCQGGFPGIFDMSGNVDEWVDACYPGDQPETSCVRAGGAYYSDGGPGRVLPDCDEVSTFARRCQNNSTGFRCCAE